jgi:protein TonB
MEVVDEKKNKTVAAASAIGLHAVLLVVFFFLVGWRAPDPPFGSTEGFVINLGFSDEGSGEVQPTVPVGSEQQETNPDETAEQTPQQEEKTEQAEPKPEETLTAKDDEAVEVKEVKKDEKKDEKKEDKPVKPVDNPTEKTEQKVTPKKEEKPLSTYNPDAAKKTDGQAGKPGGEGDDVGKTGDKGQPDGQLGPGAYKGKAGGGGDGTGLDIDGWLWDEVPSVKAPEDESTGRLVFEIKVNADGEVISIRTLQRTLSLEMEKRCKAEIEKLTFSKTGNNVPAVSVGKITFVVRTN